jgi:hypothetical protein
MLVPPSPWSGRLVAASAKAISIVHPDGAMISVVGRASDMEARALMPAEGFSGFAARAVDLPEFGGRHQSGSSDTGSWSEASWDGRYLSLGQAAEPMESHPWEKIRAVKSWPGSGVVARLDFGRRTSVWEPVARLADAAGRLSCGGVAVGKSLAGGILAGEVLVTEVRALLAEAYAAGRRAEGLHGTGAFAAGFRRLAAHPDFPAVVVGFGPGTTPAGDDWLAGFLVALDLRAGGPGKAVLDLRQRIRARLDKTTAAGRALLLGALAGAPPEYLVGLAEAAAGHVQGLAGLRDAVLNCLAHGATSGEDALAGFVSGFETNME